LQLLEDEIEKFQKFQMNLNSTKIFKTEKYLLLQINQHEEGYVYLHLNLLCEFNYYAPIDVLMCSNCQLKEAK